MYMQPFEGTYQKTCISDCVFEVLLACLILNIDSIHTFSIDMWYLIALYVFPLICQDMTSSPMKLDTEVHTGSSFPGTNKPSAQLWDTLSSEAFVQRSSLPPLSVYIRHRWEPLLSHKIPQKTQGCSTTDTLNGSLSPCRDPCVHLRARLWIDAHRMGGVLRRCPHNLIKLLNTSRWCWRG